MDTPKDSGLAAIARSTRETPGAKQLGSKPQSTSSEEKPQLSLKGVSRKTSVSIDLGIWNCIDDTAYLLTKRMRTKGGERVNNSRIIEAAFILFHDLPIEKQVELARKHD